MCKPFDKLRVNGLLSKKFELILRAAVENLRAPAVACWPAVSRFQVFLSPSCGLGSPSPSLAANSLSLYRELSHVSFITLNQFLQAIFSITSSSYPFFLRTSIKFSKPETSRNSFGIPAPSKSEPRAT